MEKQNRLDFHKDTKKCADVMAKTQGEAVTVLFVIINKSLGCQILEGNFLFLFFIFSLNVSGSGMGALSTLDSTSSLELSTVSGT